MRLVESVFLLDTRVALQVSFDNLLLNFLHLKDKTLSSRTFLLFLQLSTILNDSKFVAHLVLKSVFCSTRKRQITMHNQEFLLIELQTFLGIFLSVLQTCIFISNNQVVLNNEFGPNLFFFTFATCI